MKIDAETVNNLQSEICNPQSDTERTASQSRQAGSRGTQAKRGTNGYRRATWVPVWQEISGLTPEREEEMTRDYEVRLNRRQYVR